MGGNQRFELLAIMIAIDAIMASTIRFKEAPLVSWVPTRAYSSPGLITFKLLVKIEPACNVLRQYRMSESISQPTAPGLQPTATKIVPNPMDEIDLAIQTCLSVFQEAVSAPLQRLAHQQQAPRQIPAEQNHNQHWTQPTRTKRGLGQFLLGTVVGNVLDTVADRVLNTDHDQDLRERERHLEYQLSRIEASLNFTQCK